MRKAAAIILSLFYLLIAADASVAIHKCMGSIQSIDLIQTAKTCCCGDMNMVGCCENETVDLPQDQEDKLISTYSFAFDNDFFQLIELPSLPLIEENNPNKVVFRMREGPPRSPVPVYIQHCSFTFYG